MNEINEIMDKLDHQCLHDKSFEDCDECMNECDKCAAKDAEITAIREDLSDARNGWEQAAEAVREQDAEIERAIRLALERAAHQCMLEKVEIFEDFNEEDAAYNRGCMHSADAIRAIPVSEILEQMK